MRTKPKEGEASGYVCSTDKESAGKNVLYKLLTAVISVIVRAYWLPKKEDNYGERS
jgi:hypothetical protein